MLKLALVGQNISHSRSQEMYEKILGRKVAYSLLDYRDEHDIPKASELLERYVGVSITTPYKEHFLDEVKISQEVLPLKAINCLGKVNNQLVGTNTDFLALKEILKRYSHKNIIILGSGAMFRVCSKILQDESTSFLNFNRAKDGDIDKIDLSKYENSLIINTCARSYIFNGRLHESAIFYDLNYNFEKHVDYFSQLGNQYIDGLELLELQAKYALEFWNLK